jgi:MarR family transcriptional regulator for hemolysin
MMIEPATMVGVLDRMERDQWIRRVATPSDRRRKMIQLNARAAEVWSQVAVCARRVRAQAAQGLTPRQIAAFKKTIKLILANLRVDETVRPVEGQQ